MQVLVAMADHRAHAPGLLPPELELSKTEALMTEPPRNSPKSRMARTVIGRRRKRALSHLRGQHLEEAPLSPVSTPEHEEAIHRIRHVQGQ